MGDSIATNLFMLGFAYQQGLVPVSEAALMQAIELNGVAVEANRQSFLWGRRSAHDRATVERLVAAGTQPSDSQRLSQTLDELIARRVEYLTAYQNAAYARLFTARVERARQAESRIATVAYPLTEAVARYYFKLLAYKDEYEVARLYSDGAFLEQVRAAFEGAYQLVFHLSPPLLAKPDPLTGRPRKRRFGPWMLTAFRWLAKLKVLRGTPLDIFGYSAERQGERQLIGEYETLLDEVLPCLEADNYDTAIALAALPEQIRGYGVVKQRHIEHAKQREAELLTAFRAKGQPRQRRREKAEGVVVMTG
jgi:indolepyruvate ferredoxin oxidoreductase